MGEPVNWKAQHAIASGCIRELQAKLAKLEHETRGITFQTPDEKDARIEKLEAALREIVSYQGHDSALDINAKNMRDTAREALGLDMETIPVNLPFERVPQHANDPGFGPVPPMKCDCNYDDCLICHPLPQTGNAGREPHSSAP